MRTGQEWTQMIKAHSDHESEGIGKIFARKKIRDLKFRDPHKKHPQTQQQITALGESTSPLETPEGIRGVASSPALPPALSSGDA